MTMRKVETTRLVDSCARLTETFDGFVPRPATAYNPAGFTLVGQNETRFVGAADLAAALGCLCARPRDGLDTFAYLAPTPEPIVDELRTMTRAEES